jgi:hypothetical protein
MSVASVERILHNFRPPVRGVRAVAADEHEYIPGSSKI